MREDWLEMAILITFRNGRKQQWNLISLHELPQEMQRILIVQIKELIHEIEDYENELETNKIVFLEACLQHG